MIQIKNKIYIPKHFNVQDDYKIDQEDIRERYPELDITIDEFQKSKTNITNMISHIRNNLSRSFYTIRNRVYDNVNSISKNDFAVIVSSVK